jgi:hypothetical protein
MAARTRRFLRRMRDSRGEGGESGARLAGYEDVFDLPAHEL